MFLLDLGAKSITGKDAEDALGRAHMTVNKNAIPNDPLKAAVTSGIRIGSPALTTRGFGEAEAEKLAGLMADVLEDPRNELTLQRVAREVKTMCAKFPVYN
jgi:glycine hydroxymethyltransferase